MKKTKDMNTILCVEDNKTQQLFYARELSLEGYEIITADDGKEELEKIEEQTPDIIIMDINMPRMNGIEAIGRIVSKNKGIPIIINTAYKGYKNNFMTWAVDAYIVKSSDLSELKNKIREILTR